MRGCWRRVLVLRNSFLVSALTPQALLMSRTTLGSIVRQIWSEASRPFRFTWNSFGNRGIRIFEIVRAGFDCANRSGFTQWKCRSYKNHGSRNGGGKVPSSSSVQCNAFCLECWQHPRSCFGGSVSPSSKHLLILVWQIPSDSIPRSLETRNSSPNSLMHCLICVLHRSYSSLRFSAFCS
jgi:hypothetical protein